VEINQSVSYYAGVIAIAGTIDLIDQGARDACIARAESHQRSTRDDEPGCLAYSFSADALVPTRIQVFELWSDDDALAAHFAHPNFAAMREVLGGFERSATSIAKYLVTSVEPIGTRR
jgi:quinol monooxygenase YgiN